MRNHGNRIARIEEIARRRPTKNQLAAELAADLDRIYGDVSAMPGRGESISDMSDEEVHSYLERIAGIFGDERFNALVQRVMR